MKRVLDNVLAIIVLVSPMILMLIGFWLMGATDIKIETVNYIAGIPLAIIGMAGSIGSVEYIASTWDEE